ncbi:FTR1 family protein [Geobacter sp. SVR]|uniref:FTR1 family iron permease n=1 Tax=Geobacter sp. SVR TaxID=2495594 RepID=UPI00143EF989|nr:FTR1 family protein [Geobacter sp. SVR]BCS53224.1 iron permease [Geobacter sp. SVR]GCF84609.1 iron permease [Geobacter sp. SVR]
MGRMVRMLRAAGIFCAVALMVATGLVSTAAAKDKHALNYRELIEETGTFLNQALDLYRKGDQQGAKRKAQAAYFEVYENLEGPIRVNVSAKKNIELEEEFVAIRKMIVAGEPAGSVEKKITDFMAQLRTLAPELEGGVELVAEADKGAKPKHAEESAESGKAQGEPVWLQALETVRTGLANALETYRKGDRKKAAELVVQAQFEGYKNTLLETAVRRSVSQKKDFENNSGFSEIQAMIAKGTAPAEVEQRMKLLSDEIKADLPALALVEGAVSKREAAGTAANATSGKDWSAVTADLFREIDKAIALYKQGSVKEALLAMQDTYFDVFEASGMEAKIGSRDANFKVTLEGHFSRIVGQMKNHADASELEASLGAMKGDFAKAVDMLGTGSDSPMAIFIYSLMIILREGFEAILIITAIIAYLVKTGNRDKLKVIYNGSIAALVLSVITAVLVKWVFKTSAASQEIMEGATMLLACVVLFSISYWLISKAEAQKWSAYLKDKVGDSISSSSMWTLWFTAFLAVYREGAETVLFYQALAVDAGSASGLTALVAGFAIGCGLLVVIYLAMRHGAVKLPIRPFFLFTGALMYYMAFVFAGKGVMELIEGKMFTPSLISWMPSLPFIGVYPYVQTLIPQALIVLAALAGLAVVSRQRNLHAEQTAAKDNLQNV